MLLNEFFFFIDEQEINIGNRKNIVIKYFFLKKKNIFSLLLHKYISGKEVIFRFSYQSILDLLSISINSSASSKRFIKKQLLKIDFI